MHKSRIREIIIFCWVLLEAVCFGILLGRWCMTQKLPLVLLQSHQSTVCVAIGIIAALLMIVAFWKLTIIPIIGLLVRIASSIELTLEIYELLPWKSWINSNIFHIATAYIAVFALSLWLHMVFDDINILFITPIKKFCSKVYETMEPIRRIIFKKKYEKLDRIRAEEEARIEEEKRLEEQARAQEEVRRAAAREEEERRQKAAREEKRRKQNEHDWKITYTTFYDAVRIGREQRREESFWIVSDNLDAIICVSKFPPIVEAFGKDRNCIRYYFNIYDTATGKRIDEYSEDYFGDSRDFKFERLTKHIEHNYVKGSCKSFMEKEQMSIYIKSAKAKRQENEYYEKCNQDMEAELAITEWCKEVFFKGCDNAESLKKKYRNVMKYFHPDNETGDENTVKYIQSAYDLMMKQFK